MQRKLLSYYQHHYDIVKNMTNIYELDQYLRDHYLNKGICYAAIKLYNIDISKEYWVTDHCFGKYWFTIPDNVSTVAGQLKCLTIRISTLKQLCG